MMILMNHGSSYQMASGGDLVTEVQRANLKITVTILNSYSYLGVKELFCSAFSIVVVRRANVFI